MVFMKEIFVNFYTANIAVVVAVFVYMFIPFCVFFTVWAETFVAVFDVRCPAVVIRVTHMFKVAIYSNTASVTFAVFDVVVVVFLTILATTCCAEIVVKISACIEAF